MSLQIPSDTDTQLFLEVVDVLLAAANMKHVDKTHLNLSTPLGKGGLNVDSIEMLEIVIAFEQKYGVKLKSPEEGPLHFQNLGTVLQFVKEQRTLT